jgi:cytochrome c biogenesis protein CcdA
MRLENRPLGFVINFLLGVSWAVMLLGALTSFLSLYHDSFIVAVISAFIGAVPGLVAVLFLEHIITNKEKLHELKKQTRLLQKLLKERSGT